MDITSTVYIDEAGDLGASRGTQWFVLSAVIVDKKDEPHIRQTLTRLKKELNVNEIHIRKIKEFPRRIYITQELNCENFTYINVIFDTRKFDKSKISSPLIAYNYICRMLVERVSWFLYESGRTANIVLSSRGTSRDGELIQYIKDKLIPYAYNEIKSSVFNNISAQSSSMWDLLQLADVCATTMFLAHEIKNFDLYYPCFSYIIANHLYKRNGKVLSYGIKYFSNDMKPDDSLKEHKPCATKKRIPGATSIR